MRFKKFFSKVFVLVGLFFIVYAIFPIVAYSFYVNHDHISPIPEGSDYTNIDNWFVDENFNKIKTESKIQYYTLSIPKLSIKNAAVSIGGEDLSENLIQYPGTATPGKKGNAVIFGHSILPQFYDPTNYLAIFSKLPTLKKGDKIDITYDGIMYEYEVDSMIEVKPTDLYILEQDLSHSYLSLVTCTPPGHPLRPKRLVVRAKLINLNN